DVFEHRTACVEGAVLGVEWNRRDGERDVEDVVAGEQRIITASVRGLKIDVPLGAHPGTCVLEQHPHRERNLGRDDLEDSAAPPGAVDLDPGGRLGEGAEP